MSTHTQGATLVQRGSALVLVETATGGSPIAEHAVETTVCVFDHRLPRWLRDELADLFVRAHAERAGGVR